MVDEKKYLEAILNGTFHVRRFTRKEQGCSSDAADRFLWLAILRAELELAGEGSAGVCGGAAKAAGAASSPSGFLTSLADELPSTFGKLAEGLGRFCDRGRESVVFDAGDGRYSGGGDDAEDDDADSSSEDSEQDSGEHLKFYNSDYYISALQPGRNTVIDGETGNVRFIDPRITLNDPDGPITPVSRFGMRHETVSPMSFVL